jgi:transcriptional regulator with XRE-family HTH domain
MLRSGVSTETPERRVQYAKLSVKQKFSELNSYPVGMGKEKPFPPIYARIKDAFGDASDANIARALGIGKSAVSQWRNGITVPSTDTLLLISEITGFSLAFLKGEEESSLSEREGNREVETLSQPMTFERFISELRALGVEDFHSIKSMEGLSSADWEEIIVVAKNNARTTAKTMIEQRLKRRGE